MRVHVVNVRCNVLTTNKKQLYIWSEGEGGRTGSHRTRTLHLEQRGRGHLGHGAWKCDGNCTDSTKSLNKSIHLTPHTRRRRPTPRPQEDGTPDRHSTESTVGRERSGAYQVHRGPLRLGLHHNPTGDTDTTTRRSTVPHTRALLVLTGVNGLLFTVGPHSSASSARPPFANSISSSFAV